MRKTSVVINFSVENRLFDIPNQPILDFYSYPVPRIMSNSLLRNKVCFMVPLPVNVANRYLVKKGFYFGYLIK